MLKFKNIGNSRYWELETVFTGNKEMPTAPPGFPDLAGRTVSEVIEDLMRIDCNKKNYLIIHMDDYAEREDGRYAFLPFALTYYALRFVRNIEVILTTLRYDDPVDYAIATDMTIHLMDMAEYLREFFTDNSYTSRIWYQNRKNTSPVGIMKSMEADKVFTNKKERTTTTGQENGLMVFDHLPIIRNNGEKSDGPFVMKAFLDKDDLNKEQKGPFCHIDESMTLCSSYIRNTKNPITSRTTTLQNRTICPFRKIITGSPECRKCPNYKGEKNLKLTICTVRK